ncbi:MAG TPA: hypothetical protein VJ483_05590 [Holophagaceae bacterium]|nr:hypothetical protein [Holophagaceae bacterium]
METPPHPQLPPSQLGVLREGWRMLRRHPLLSLGLLALAVLLGQLGPVLELAARTGGSPGAQLLFAFVSLLPLEIYALPLFLARLDAELIGDPANPREGWRPGFESRWLRVFGAKLLVVSMGAVGCVLILPGLLTFLFFGWAPLRVLLRGERLVDALRWSGRAMLRCWPRIVQAVLAIALVWLAGQLLMRGVLAGMLPRSGDEIPDAATRLRHPAFWIAGGLAGLVHLWSSAAFLALYQRLERLAQSSEIR